LPPGRQRAIQEPPLPQRSTIALEALVRHVFGIRSAGTAVAVVLLTAACSGDSDDDQSAPPLPVATATSLPPSSAPDVSADDAVAIALDAVGGGEVLETDIDEFDVEINVWEITVVTPDGVRRTVTVDMGSGSIIANEVDD
jgi:uncharacterized membrane protein YkoI